MIVPFDITVSYSGSAVIKRVFLKSDNSVLDGLITNALSGTTDITKLSSWGISPPTTGFYVAEYTLTVDAAAKVELGLVKADGTTFIPLFPTYATESTGGGLVRRHGSNGPIFPDDTGIAASIVNYAVALRVTGATNPSTIHIAGDISIQPRG